MSLTSELNDPESSLSAFMAAQFPQVKEFSAMFRAARPADAEALQPPVEAGTRVAWGTLNAAIDHRLRYAFTDSRALPESVERGMAGAFRLAPVPAAREAIRRAGDDLEAMLSELIAAEQPASRSRSLLLPKAAEERFARLCYAMAWFEEVYRTRRLWPGTPLGEARPGFTVKTLLDAVPGYAVEDLKALAEVASSALGELRAACPPCHVHAGPDFAGSSDVGNAEADLIVGGLLIDVKGTVAPSRLRKPEFYQLLGYALLDYDDEYGIDRLGFYLARFGRLITWPVGEYVAMLGGRRPIGELRQACREALVG
jgi:hypothetical protein